MKLKWLSTVLLSVGLCLIALAGRGQAIQAGCSPIYQDTDWSISSCPTDPNVPATMSVWLDGVAQAGSAARLEVAHVTGAGTSWPTVAVLYASGYVRLKQNADPAPPIPFGSSAILGPAYWSETDSYFHSSQLTRVEIDTRWLPGGPLRLQVAGTNGAFAVAYELTFPAPRDRQTRLHVLQTYTATTGITVDPTRHAEAQGFKLVQASSMFINQGGACDDEHDDCHDSDAARFIGGDGARRQVGFGDLGPSTWVYSHTFSLGSTWLDVLHSDDASWQGNTPNLRIALDALPADHSITAQGWISATTNPDEDNVGLWLHDDGPASRSWTAGQGDQVGYWLLAQDDPPEPWADLGLRDGQTALKVEGILDFENAFNCFFVHDVAQTVTGTVQPIRGYADTALELRYSLGITDTNWVQIRCDFDPPLDLSASDHLRLDWRGDPTAANSVEIGLIDQVTTTQRIVARGYHHVTQRGWWGQLVVPFAFLEPWHGGTFDPHHVVALFVSVVKDGPEDTGDSGSLAIDNLSAFNVMSRTVLADFVPVTANPAAMATAAQWLAQQQLATGLLKSWAEEPVCTAHIYDQALALLVFSREGMWTQADALVGALVQAQHADGSWSKSYQANDANLPCVHCHEWEGDIAWAVYALSRYCTLGGAHPQAYKAMEQGATWLAGRIAPDGCLEIDHTEGTIDAWWALQAAGPGYRDEADGLKACLLSAYWDETMGRFKGGRDWQQPYLDNQTWGAAFLRAIGRKQDALRALSYACRVLRLPAQGGQLVGFDGQGGPWSVWNEGTGQYVAMGGEQADDLLLELLAQQRTDGAMPGSPDDFTGGGVWTTRWHGVSPTAWLYFAQVRQGPFQATTWTQLPLLLKGER
ncbi:MAG: hypothetical protein JXM73_19615 [Anaerolineae bacterium]|nr:hypothetical protein [Anaerolineae bacterium]